MSVELSKLVGETAGEVKGLKDTIRKFHDRMNRIDRKAELQCQVTSALEREIDKRLCALERKQYAIYAVAAIIASALSLAVRILL